MSVHEPSLLDFCAVWLGNCFPTFRGNVPPSSSMLLINARTHKPEYECGIYLRNVEKSYPPTWRNKPEEPVLIKFLSAVPFPAGRAPTVPHDPTVSSVYSSVSVLLVTQTTRRMSVIVAAVVN